MVERADEQARVESAGWPKTARFGLAMFGVSSVLVATPLAFELSGLAKYFVAFAFLSACLGSLCVVLAAIEWLQSRK